MAIGTMVFRSIVTPWRVISVKSRGDNCLLDTGRISSRLIIGEGGGGGLFSLCEIFATILVLIVCNDMGLEDKVGGEIFGCIGGEDKTD